MLHVFHVCRARSIDISDLYDQSLTCRLKFDTALFQTVITCWKTIVMLIFGLAVYKVSQYSKTSRNM